MSAAAASSSTAAPAAAKKSIDWVRVTLGVTTVVAIGALWYTVYSANAAERKERLFKAKQSDALSQLRSPPGGIVQLRSTKTTNMDTS